MIFTWIVFAELDWKMSGSERSCCVPSCGKTRADNIILHKFPNPEIEKERFLAWMEAVGCNVSNLDYQFVFLNRRVCHDHFETKYLTWTKRLSPGSIPTLLLPGPVMARAPMLDLTNIDNRGETSASNIENKQKVLPTVEKAVNIGVSDAILSRGEAAQGRVYKKMEFLGIKKQLEKTIKSLKIKKETYETRLKKALKLSENKTFQHALQKFTTLAAMFTIMQFREIKKKKMGRRFTESEKIMSLSLYKRSPRAYRWLQKIFVLPSPLTLNRLIARANLNPGINHNIFQQLLKKVKTMNADGKLCILLFDEMSLAPHFDYNLRKDSISGFVNNGKSRHNKIADHALVFMIRGIQKNYKQPIAYTFCSGSTGKLEMVALIKEIIRKLHSVGLCVLATVCDQGASNVSAINYLIKETKENYLRNNKEYRRETFEVDEKEIIPLYDPPHLIKGIRNNLLNKNLLCTIDGSSKTAKWEHIVKLYEEDPAYKGIRLVKKLTEHHVNPDKFQKMKVKYATQVLSRKVAVTMGFLAESNLLPKECTQTADVILFFDELFDSLNGSFDNSKKKSGKELLYALTPRSRHSEVWSNAKLVLSSMKFVVKQGKEKDKQVTVPTITNLLHTIKNIEYIREILFNKYKIKSIWLRHFNQDPLENFFGSIRSHGCRNTNPTPAGFGSSFSSLLISNLSGQHSPGSNCEEDSCHVMFKSMKSFFKNPRISAPNELVHLDFSNVYVEFEIKKRDPRIIAALQYVTGYLLKKAKHKIFGNCTKCRDCFYDENTSSNFLKVREYKKQKLHLTYPRENLVQLFSKKQDLITYVLKKQSLMENLRTYLKTILYTELDFDIFTCEIHKQETIDYMLELSCIFFICNWCKDTNKILNGTRLELDESDNVKIMAFDHCNKRKHLKK